MRFELRRVTNGAVLRIEYDIGEEVEVEELVYQEPNEEENEVEAFAEFLRAINEHYGPSTTRYSPKRVHVLVEPGDKHEDLQSADGGSDAEPPRSERDARLHCSKERRDESARFVDDPAVGIGILGDEQVVDDVGAARLDHAGGLGHGVWFAAEDLIG